MQKKIILVTETNTSNFEQELQLGKYYSVNKLIPFGVEEGELDDAQYYAFVYKTPEPETETGRLLFKFLDGNKNFLKYDGNGNELVITVAVHIEESVDDCFHCCGENIVIYKNEGDIDAMDSSFIQIYNGMLLSVAVKILIADIIIAI